MAFDTYKANFIPAAANDGNSRGPRIHTYRSADAHGTIDAADYFLAVKPKLKIGDLIYHAQVSNIDASNEAIVDAQFFVVIALTSTSVTVSAETAVVVAGG